MTIGIIGAMEVEVAAIRNRMDLCEVRAVSGIDFCIGLLEGKRIVVAQCGPGKVNAAVATQTMILLYQPDIIINTGVAGGLFQGMQTLDLVIARSVCQHDMDTTAVGDPAGEIPRLGMIELACDAAVNEVLEKCARNLGYTHVVTGVIATGDQFIASNVRREQIREQFHAVAVEMEGGSVGHVCKLNSVPFAVVRVLSDASDDNGGMSYTQFMERAANASSDLVLEFVKEYR